MKILSLDVESNGLHGEPFAVGAVILDTETLAVVSSFAGRAPIVGNIDDYVAQNVMPAVKSIPKIANARELRQGFWLWYKLVEVEAVFADVGYPVEVRFLSLCQREVEDFWGGPYPLHEVATLLFAAGIDPDINRVEFVGDLLPKMEGLAHNPLTDATVSAYCVAKALRLLAREPVKKKKANRVSS